MWSTLLKQLYKTLQTMWPFAEMQMCHYVSCVGTGFLFRHCGGYWPLYDVKYFSKEKHIVPMSWWSRVYFFCRSHPCELCCPFLDLKCIFLQCRVNDACILYESSFFSEAWNHEWWIILSYFDSSIHTHKIYFHFHFFFYFCFYFFLKSNCYIFVKFKV